MVGYIVELFVFLLVWVLCVLGVEVLRLFDTSLSTNIIMWLGMVSYVLASWLSDKAGKRFTK